MTKITSSDEGIIRNLITLNPKLILMSSCYMVMFKDGVTVDNIRAKYGDKVKIIEDCKYSTNIDI